MKRFSLSILLLAFTLVSRAQAPLTTEPAMADQFRENGKIYVVISVIAMVFLAILAFLVILERKIKKLETKMNINKLNS